MAGRGGEGMSDRWKERLIWACFVALILCIVVSTLCTVVTTARGQTIGAGVAGLKPGKASAPDFVANLGDPEMSGGLVTMVWAGGHAENLGFGVMRLGKVAATWRTRLTEDRKLLGKDFAAESDLTVTSSTQFTEACLFLGWPVNGMVIGPGILAQRWTQEVLIEGHREGEEPVIASWQKSRDSCQAAIAARAWGPGWTASALGAASISGSPGYSATLATAFSLGGGRFPRGVRAGRLLLPHTDRRIRPDRHQGPVRGPERTVLRGGGCHERAMGILQGNPAWCSWPLSGRHDSCGLGYGPDCPGRRCRLRRGLRLPTSLVWWMKGG